MAFKNTVTFKIHRRQEYMQNIEQNYKEVMKQKEQINNQRQSEIRIIQSIQTQKSFSDLNSASPITQTSSPLIRNQSFQQILLRQLSQSVIQTGGESPQISQFDLSQRLNTLERKNLLTYCTPSNRNPNKKNSMIDLDSLSSNNNSNQSQNKFKLLQNYSQDSIAKQVLSTLHEVDQHQQDDEEEQKSLKNYQPQLKLIKLVRTQNNILLPDQLDRQFSLKSHDQIESNISNNKSNTLSPTLVQKFKLMSEIQSEDKSLMQNSLQPTEKKFVRNNMHSKTYSCISQISQTDLQLSSLNIPSFSRRKEHSNKSKSQLIQSPLSQQKQQNHLLSIQQSPQPNDVIRQENLQELTDLQEFLDVQYFETKYNPEKLEELLKAVEELKMKQKNNKNVIENQLEFLYNKSSKEMCIRIDQIKQKIHNQYRHDLNHQNDQYIKNRQNIYSNSPTKAVDKIAALSKYYQKKQDGYDKIIRSSIVSKNTMFNYTTNLKEVVPQNKREKSKELESQIKNLQDNLQKSSSMESKHTSQNEKNTMDTVSSNNNLDFSSQNQNILISKLHNNKDSLQSTRNTNNVQINENTSSSIGINLNKNIESENHLNTNYFIKTHLLKNSVTAQSPSKFSPISLITQSSLKQTNQQVKFSQSPIKQQSSPQLKNNSAFNFNIIKYETSKSGLASSTGQAISQGQQPQSPIKLENINNQKSHLINQLFNDKDKKQEINQIKTISQSQIITPTISQRRDLASISISRQLQKPFVIKFQSNNNKPISISPLKTQQQNQQYSYNQQNSPQSVIQEENKFGQNLFLKHRKTQSQLIFDVQSPKQIEYQTQQHSVKGNSFSSKFNQNSQEQKNVSQQQKFIKHSSMHNLTELLNLSQVNTPQAVSSTQDFIQYQPCLTANPSPNSKSNYRKYLNKKLNAVVEGSTASLNSTKVNLDLNNNQPHSHMSQQQQQYINNQQESNSQQNFIYQNVIAQKQIQPNSKSTFMNNRVKVFKGSTINSNQVSTNSTLFSNSPLTYKQSINQS